MKPGQLTVFLIITSLMATIAYARPVEKLGRGLTVTTMKNGSAYLSWRLLPDDPDDVSFNVFRIDNGEKNQINTEAIVGTTDFIDSKSGSADYELDAVSGGKTFETSTPSSRSVEVSPGTACRSFEIKNCDYASRIGIGDLDGDGNIDFLIKQPGDVGVDPYYKSWHPSEKPFFLEAYRHDGSLMWRYDLGWSIESGVWYSPVAVFDLDGDGAAEVAVKNSDGDYRDAEGHVYSGPEYLSILDGRTGKLIASTDWISREPWLEAMGPEWGFEYSSRNQIMVACLDGETTSVVIMRGTYDINIVSAFDFRDGKLVKRWTFDNREEPKEYYGQGAHIINSADVDNDGRDELFIGSDTLDDDGNPLWSTGLDHPDALYVSDFDPERPGLEVFYGLEMIQNANGVCLADALTGEILWGIDTPTKHVHSLGLAGDIIADLPGSEFYGRDRETPGNAWFLDAKGRIISDPPFTGQSIKTVYWDADPQREILMGGVVNFGEKDPIGQFEGTPLAVADIEGDWREEIITSIDGTVRIYSTTLPAEDRRTVLLSDPIYRINAVAFTSGYWHPLMLSYDMASAGE